MGRNLTPFVITFLIGMAAILLFPYYVINPGVVIEDHMKLKNDCFACHTLGKGAVTNKCASCHNPSFIGLKTADGLQRTDKNLRSYTLHNSITNIQCFDCHTEHNGLSRENATLKFRHNVLSGDTRKKCTNCHTPEKPEDTLHKGLGRTMECAQCHTTDGWKPSTFDHTKYFRFDGNHPSDCANCHDMNKTLKTYTCYNCHEHTPSRIAKKHLKEGIVEFENCVKCHTTGDKKETHGIENKNRWERKKDDD